MKITRDVVTDLLPVYTSGEASADTRAVVEDYFREDPEFASMVRAAADGPIMPVLTAPPVALIDRTEKSALVRSRRMLRRRSWAMGLALLCTLLPFTIVHTETIRFLMIRDEPRSAVLFVVAAGLWAWYYRLDRRLTGTGL